LYSFLDGVFAGTGGGGHFGLLGVKFHELGQIELGLFEDLQLADNDILEGENLVAFLGDLLVDSVTEELLEEIAESVGSDFLEEDLHHLGTELLLLGALSVASSLDLLGVTAGESNSENTHEVTIGGLGLHEGLNEGVPLLDESAEAVTGDVHTVEVGVEVVSLDFFALEADLAPRLFVGGGVKVTERHGEDTATEGISSDLLTGSLVAGSQGGHTGIENAGHMYVVPFFLDESMNNFLLLLALLLEVAGILAGGHYGMLVMIIIIIFRLAHALFN
jgi:hypothetical protein